MESNNLIGVVFEVKPNFQKTSHTIVKGDDEETVNVEFYTFGVKRSVPYKIKTVKKYFEEGIWFEV